MSEQNWFPKDLESNNVHFIKFREEFHNYVLQVIRKSQKRQDRPNIRV